MHGRLEGKVAIVTGTAAELAQPSAKRWHLNGESYRLPCRRDFEIVRRVHGRGTVTFLIPVWRLTDIVLTNPRRTAALLRPTPIRSLGNKQMLGSFCHF